ncbi:MAG: tail fiber domain-containing protein, partial [Flavobacteriales bacterium]|nr:tail fiber domain-containing protein [Flavobacteriales bacterium]
APLSGSLNTLLGLRGVSFEYKDPAAIHELPGTRIGFIAQEVEQVMPDWVEEVDGYKRLTIRGFEALAVEALRELQAENTALRDELETLRGQQTRLMSALERTEARLDAIEHGTAPANAGR